MKMLAIPAVALGLLLTVPAAMAAPNDYHGGVQIAAASQNDKTTRKTHKAKTSRRKATAAARRANTKTHRANAATRRANARTHRANAATRRAKATTHRANKATRRANARTHRANMATRRANRATNRAHFARYRANVQATRRYHWNTYRRPRGWYAHRWTYNERLPAAFFIRSYWITGYLNFGLMVPPAGLVWVRVGDDALLIDRRTGEVVRAEYGLFD